MQAIHPRIHATLLLNNDPHRYRSSANSINQHNSAILHEINHSKGCEPRRPDMEESYGWRACVGAKDVSNADSLATFCLANDLIGLGYTVLEDGRVMTAAQMEALDPPVPDSFRAGHRNGSVTRFVDDPDSPYPGWGDKVYCALREGFLLLKNWCRRLKNKVAGTLSGLISCGLACSF